jgi:hypothetical protein
LEEEVQAFKEGFDADHGASGILGPILGLIIQNGCNMDKTG